MSIGARPGTTLAEIETEFVRITGNPNRFYFMPWYCTQLRALRGSMGYRFPIAKAEQEQALLQVSRATPSTHTRLYAVP